MSNILFYKLVCGIIKISKGINDTLAMVYAEESWDTFLTQGLNNTTVKFHAENKF
jgi:hypothetical protein